MNDLESLQISFASGDLSPDRTVEKLVRFYEDFTKSNNSVGCDLVTISFDDLIRHFEDQRSPALAVLPEYISVGEIGLESCNHEGVGDMIETMFIPALVNLRESSGLLYEMGSSGYELAQLNMLRLMLTLDSDCSKLTIVDVNGFGSNVKILRNAVTDCILITSHEDLQDLVRRLQVETSHRMDQMDPLCHWIYEHNAKHRDRKVPYHFIYIADLDGVFDERDQTQLIRLLKNFNAAKAGIYFVFCGFGDFFQNNECESNNFVSIVERYEHLEVIDPKGIDTTENSKYSLLEVKKEEYSDTTLETLIRLSKKHLNETKQTIIEFSTDPSKFYLGSASAGISIPVGKNNKGENVDFTLGNPAIVYNALVGGAVGTGKTVLLHAIAMGVAQKYSPDEIALSILDYKEGTEFIGYRDLPHLFALSAGPNVDFGIELLTKLKTILVERGSLFKREGASNLEDYRKKTGLILPRHLVLIDEFHVLLTNERLGQKAQQLIEDLVRRGRSFGINFILSSQSLADYSLTQSLSSNIGLRLCLRLSSSECGRFLDIGNELPTTFKKVGQALMNDGEGRVESNSLFQVAYYSEEVIERLIKTLPKGRDKDRSLPYVYEHDDAYSIQEVEHCCGATDDLILGAKQALELSLYTVSLNKSAVLVLVDANRESAYTYSLMLEHQLENKGYSFIECQGNEVSQTIDKIEECEDRGLVALAVSVQDDIDLYELGELINSQVRPICNTVILKTSSYSDDLMDALGEPYVVYFDEESYRSKYTYTDDLEGCSLGEEVVAVVVKDAVKYVGNSLILN